MGGAILDLVRDFCSYDVRDVLQHFDKTGLYSPALSAPSTSAWSSRGAALRSDTVAEDQISGGSKRKKYWSRIGGLQVARASSFLQYLTKWGIDYYIVSKYLFQIYFKATLGRFELSTLGYPAGGSFEVFKGLF